MANTLLLRCVFVVWMECGGWARGRSGARCCHHIIVVTFAPHRFVYVCVCAVLKAMLISFNYFKLFLISNSIVNYLPAVEGISWRATTIPAQLKILKREHQAKRREDDEE